MKYLLGYCSNITCSEFDGGWKYDLDYPVQEKRETYCPECGERLNFITQEDDAHD